MKEIAFGKNLKNLIWKNGMDQKTFAKKIGVCEATISQYINGKRLPSVLLACEIANALNVTIDELIWKKGGLW